MENIKKNPLSLQLNAEDFLPASNEEKQSLVVMRESVNFWKDGIRRLKKNKIAMVSFVFIIAIAIFAYLLPAVWPYSYSEQMKGSNNLKPFEYSASEQARIDAGEKVFPHILGTDRMGRDFAVRIMMGTRVSLSVGLIASVLVLIIGATYGAVAAFAGGWVDNIMMRITDILYTIPDILLIILLGMALKDPLDALATKPGFKWMQTLGPNMISIFIIFALLYWVGMARIVRCQSLILKESEYVTAARALGDALRDAAAQPPLSGLDVEVLGPAGAPVVKVNNRYRYCVYLCGKGGSVLRRTVSEYLLAFYARKENRGLDIFADCNALQ